MAKHGYLLCRTIFHGNNIIQSAQILEFGNHGDNKKSIKAILMLINGVVMKILVLENYLGQMQSYWQ